MATNDTLAAAEQLVITETKKQGMRVHRATCKRQGSLSGDLRKAAGFRPEAVKEAKAATCCKPANVPDIITAVLAAEADAAEMYEDAQDDANYDLVNPEPLVEEGDTKRVVKYPHAKHFWRAMVVSPIAATYLASTVTLTMDGKAQTITVEGAQARVKKAVKVLEAAWDAAYAEFKDWKKSDEAYKALPKGKEKWAAQDAYKREQEFLTAAVRSHISASA